jgi:hypothetical protein
VPSKIVKILDDMKAIGMPTRPPIGPSGWGTDAISGAASVPGHQRKDADEPVRDFSFIRLFNGAPELAERSEGWEQRPVLSQHDSGRSTREDQLPALIRALEIGEAEAEWARKEALEETAVRSLRYPAAPERISPRPRRPWRAGHRRTAGP